MDQKVTRQIRQSILDTLRLEKVRWWGALDDVAFLSRIFDLKSLPSHDVRYDNAAGDIWQHRINNDDWVDDWVFMDDRFDLLGCSDELFLSFLCELVHPVVQPDREQSERMVGFLNPLLSRAGIQLEEIERLAGRPRYEAVSKAGASQFSVDRAAKVAAALEAGWMEQEISRLEKSVAEDPALAIGTCKDLLESCLKTILDQRSVEFSKSATLPQLTKLVLKELELLPDDVSDSAKGADTIRLILRNLSAITGYLAELRGLYGSGHGRTARHRGLEARHARLAVGAAATFIDFIADAHRRKPVRE